MVPDAVGAAGTHEALWGCCRAGAPGCTSPRVYLSGGTWPGRPPCGQRGQGPPSCACCGAEATPPSKKTPKEPRVPDLPLFPSASSGGCMSSFVKGK